MYRKTFEIANSPQLAVELPTARHAASTVPLPSTAMVPLSRPWDAFAVLSLLSARKPAAKFASVIRWTGSSAPRSRLPAPFFALRWILTAAAASARSTTPRRTAFASARAPEKASNLSKNHLRLPAQALVAPRTSPLKSLPSRANAPSLAAPKGSLSRSLPPRSAAWIHAVQRSSPTWKL